MVLSPYHLWRIGWWMCALLLSVGDSTRTSMVGAQIAFETPLGAAIPSSSSVASSEVPSVSPSSTRGESSLNCTLSFSSVTASSSFNDSGIDGMEAHINIAHLCPAHCLSAVVAAPFRSDSANEAAPGVGAVYGSFPYHRNSSICLAAVHAGTITEEAGGSVFISRFLRQDWSGTSSQTVFPHRSAYGSVSNGVASLDVHPDWFTQPADEREYSFTVRGRGDFVSQRRTAPFSPRADHSHVFWADPHDLTSQYWLSQLRPHLIVGGYNGTHYLNDVWLRILPRWTPDVRWDVDCVWIPLAPAPFSPRSDLLFHVAVDNDHPTPWWTIDFIGGQVDHMCGLYEFGVCSGEVWQANVTVDSALQLVNVTWSHLIEDMPFRPQCDSALLFALVPHWSYAVIGGQLSYDDATCASALEYADHSVWLRDASQWMRMNTSVVSRLDPLLLGRRGVIVDDQLIFDNWSDVEFGGFLGGLVGGLRYLSHRVIANDSTGRPQAILTSARIYSDTWLCDGVLRDVSLSWIICGYPMGDNVSSLTGSMPLPMTATPNIIFPDGNLRMPTPLIGITSRQAVVDWQATIPPFLYSLDDQAVLDVTELGINVTGIFQWDVDLVQDVPTREDVAFARFGLPMFYDLSEEELNDRTAPFFLGSDWVASRTAMTFKNTARQTHTLPSFISVHPQPFSISNSPQQSSWFVPQAASSSNSSRPEHSFRMRRRDASAAVWIFSVQFDQPEILAGEMVISGGRSGSLYNNDWLVVHEIRCLPADDPSFLSVLGPLTVLDGDGGSEDGSSLRGSYTEKDEVRVQCGEGHHFEPPIRQRQVSLTCAANGMWIDMEVSSIRRCVPNKLDCPSPWVDFGFLRCDEPTAIVDQILVSLGIERQPNDFALIVQKRQQLAISGKYFTLPLRVFVGGSVCELPQLVLRSVSTLCLNSSSAHSRSQSVSTSESASSAPAPPPRLCRDFGSGITCVITDLRGVNQAVVVLSGEHSAMAEVSGSQPFLSVGNPVIYALSCPQCNTNDSNPLQLTNCSHTEPLQLSVLCLTASVGDISTLIFLEGVGSADPLTCTPFVPVYDTPTSLSQCSVPPRLGVGLRLRVHQQRDLLTSEELATLSFARCPPGQRNNLQPTVSANNTMVTSDPQPVCVPCEPGFSTGNLSDASQCEPCLPGSFSDSPGTASCSLCGSEKYQSEHAGTSCLDCPLNSFQPSPGSLSCVGCSLDSYIVVESSEDAQSTSYQCAPCPLLGDCAAGNISAQSGGYLVYDLSTRLISSSRCPPSACLQASSGADVCAGQAAQAQAARVVILNCCASGRYPAYDPSAEALSSTEGFNILCSLCLPGYSLVNGRCIECSAVQWGPLFFVVLVLLGLVFALHRIPSALDGSASVLIGSYLMQQSALFLSSSSTPQWFSLALFSVFGADGQRGLANGQIGDADDSHNFYKGFCIAPMSDWDRLGIQLLSPFIALGLLTFVAGTHLISRQVVRKSVAGEGEDEMTSDSKVAQLYRVAFFPRTWLHSTATPSQLALSANDQPPLSLSVPGVQSPTASPGVLWLPYQRTVVRLLQLSYNVLALVTLTFFRYEDVGRFGQRVADYTTIDPASSQYRAWMGLFVVILVLVVCGLPALMAVWLWREQRAGRLLLSWQRSGPLPVNDLNKSADTDSSLVSDDLRLQLTGMFRASCWWMFPFLLCRRLLLVIVLVAIRNGSVWIWLSFVNSCLVIVQVALQPYKFSRDNWLETLVLMSLTVQTTLLSLYPPPNISPLVFSALNSLVLGPLIIIAGTSMRRLCRRRPTNSGGSKTVPAPQDSNWKVQLEQRLLERHEEKEDSKHSA